MSDLERARQVVARASRVVVFTGAGMSAESGVPTFRDALTGLWAKFDPMTLATPEAWADDPDLVWAWYAERAERVRAVAPNPGHVAIAELATAKAADGRRVDVVTQNVDDLHERAGAEVIAHLHGSLFAPRCESCGRPETPDTAVAAPRPKCPLCGESVRPGVVWFGEMLPESDWRAAESAVRAADLMIIVGTSGVVRPAADLPRRAFATGIPIIEVNPQPSDLTDLATLHLEGTAGQILPDLLAG